ncbi:MAG: HlyD family efflux transporter periplasmic adaptor subunit [Clostridia bacterium]|nr:HlyD family efflux transporter periplasmic adaptor subunit [Clostridia bacterium]
MKKKNIFSDKRLLVNTICAILVIGVLAYLFHEVFNANYSAYQTDTVVDATYQETLDVKGFIVRDESYISGETNGTVVPLVTDGNRVASADSVAVVCSSSESAKNYSRLTECKAELERYKKLSEQTELNALNMEKLNKEIDGIYTELLSVAAGGSYTELDDKVTELENKLASKQIISSGSIDLADKISELEDEVNTLESENTDNTKVYAPKSGYYISSVDGYENTIAYTDVSNVTVAEIEAALESKPDTVQNTIGKIVGSYKWYIVCAVDSRYYNEFSAGQTRKINIPYYGYDNVAVTVESVSKVQSGKAAIVLSCNMMNDVYANMRIENIEIVMDEFSGFKVDSNAVRTEKDESGQNVTVVYILRGNIMNVRRIEIIYDAGDYVIVSDKTQSQDGYRPVKRYDEVIVKGRNLSNGKSVK